VAALLYLLARVRIRIVRNLRRVKVVLMVFVLSWGLPPQNVMFLFNLPALLVTVNLVLLVILMMGSALATQIRGAHRQPRQLKLTDSPARTLQMLRVASHVLALTIRASPAKVLNVAK
jgi:hypothetical protein